MAAYWCRRKKYYIGYEQYGQSKRHIHGCELLEHTGDSVNWFNFLSTSNSSFSDFLSPTFRRRNKSFLPHLSRPRINNKKITTTCCFTAAVALPLICYDLLCELTDSATHLSWFNTFFVPSRSSKNSSATRYYSIQDEIVFNSSQKIIFFSMDPFIILLIYDKWRTGNEVKR